MVVYYNVQNIPKQDYRVISHTEKDGEWTGKAFIEHAINPLKTPSKEIDYYLIQGENDEKFYVDANTLLIGFSHHLIHLTNAYIAGNTIHYNRY